MNLVLLQEDPNNKYPPLTDVILVLNDLTVDDWSIIIGGFTQKCQKE